jgi:hypothetical protein
MRRLLLCALLTVSALTGCNTPAPPYMSPSIGETATVRFIEKAGGVNLGVAYARGKPQGCGCSSEPLEEIGIFHNVALLVPGHASYADKGENVSEFVVKVRADGTPFRFVMGLPSSSLSEQPGYVTSSYCQAHESFIPVPGETYEVTHDPAQAKCHMSVNVVRGANRSPVETVNYPPCALRADNADGISDRIRNVCQAHPDVYTR